MKQNVAVIVAHGDRMVERDKVVKASYLQAGLRLAASHATMLATIL